jgi:putative intracellular protease/amidase
MKTVNFLSVLLLLFVGLTSSLFAQSKILVVVTNNEEVNVTIGDKDTIIAGGYELSELAEAHKVFVASGFEVDFMSPAGGRTHAEPEEEMKAVNKAFLSNPENVAKLENTLSPSAVKAQDYVAIYFVGGKTMWDFPNSKGLAQLTAEIYEGGGVVGAVCHGPAALVNVKLSDGSSLIEGKKISSFTDMEEQLFSKTGKFLPFLLQDKLISLGADFQEAPAMLDQVVVDQRLVTGQNPSSTYSVAEEMVKQLGAKPPARDWTNMSYTLGVLRAVIMEDDKKAKHFYEAHAKTNQLDEGLFQGYVSYANNGYLGEIAKAKGFALLKFAAEVFPNSARSHEALAKAYHQLGQEKEALAAIARALSIDPDAASAQKLKAAIEDGK